MTLYVFHFDTYKNEVVSLPVEVEEKPKTYKATEGTIPFTYITKILKEDLNKITRDVNYISTKNDPVAAVRAFRKYWAEKAETAKKTYEMYDNYYHSCFKFADENGVRQIP